MKKRDRLKRIDDAIYQAYHLLADCPTRGCSDLLRATMDNAIGAVRAAGVQCQDELHPGAE